MDYDFLLWQKYTQMLMNIISKISAAISHRGDVTHHQDQLTRFVSFKIRNTTNTIPGRLQPSENKGCLFFIG